DGWKKSRRCCYCFTCAKCVVGGLRRGKEREQEYLFQQPPTEGCSIEKGETFIQRFHRVGGGLFHYNYHGLRQVPHSLVSFIQN
ncbi:unnamed protein product, partial [Ectocarpus sp. 12 AP-2014]